MFIENLIDQIDDQGQDTRILEEIVAFRCDTDVDILKEEQSYTNSKGIHCPVINTKGWDVRVKWIDQSVDWVLLHLIKESNPIEVILRKR